MKKILFWLIVLSILTTTLLFKSNLNTVSANPDYICTKAKLWTCKYDNTKVCWYRELNNEALKDNCRYNSNNDTYECNNGTFLDNNTDYEYFTTSKDNAFNKFHEFTLSWNWIQTNCCLPWNNKTWTRTCYWTQTTAVKYYNVRISCEKWYTRHDNGWNSNANSWRQWVDQAYWIQDCSIVQEDILNPEWEKSIIYNP